MIHPLCEPGTVSSSKQRCTVCRCASLWVRHVQADEYMADIDLVLAYSATTSCPQLGMSSAPGYTFFNGGPGACGDGWFPIDGRLLGNSYRAFCPVMFSMKTPMIARWTVICSSAC